MFNVACPLCGPERRSTVNQRRKVLRVWCEREGYITFRCARCEAAGWVTADGQKVASKPEAVSATPPDAERTARAIRLWRQATRPGGTLVDCYLANRGLELPLARDRVDRQFLDMLTTYATQKRPVSPHKGPGYAPAVFAKDGMANGTTARAFSDAMNRLFNSSRIEIDEVGPPSRRVSRLVRAGG